MRTTATIAALAIALAAAAGTASAAAVNILSSNFDTGVILQTTGPFPFATLSFTPGGAAITPAEAFPGFGTGYLRNATTGTTTFDVTGLGAHTDLHLSFDLAFIDSWDGPNPGPFGPDFLNLVIGGAPLQLSSPGQLGPGTLVGTGAFGQNPSWQDAVAHYDLVIPHSAADFSFSLTAGGGGFQGGLDESWGIDNIVLGATSGGVIPEPSVWALMIGGLGLAGSALRRQRRALA